MLSQNPVYDSFTNKEGEWCNHIDLAEWADIFVIAPATANTLFKMAHASCDNLLLATYLSYPTHKPLFIAPAMDAGMYAHPLVKKNLETLSALGYHFIYPTTGFLASGIEGEGRLEEPCNILDALEKFSKISKRVNLLSGKKVLITYGGTREQLDPVRYIGNHSMGRMGVALVESFLSMGATVLAISAYAEVKPELSNSDYYQEIKVSSAQEMHKAVEENYSSMDIVVMAAAISDYTPAKVFVNKIKKKTSPKLNISFEQTKDTIAFVGERKLKNTYLVGFALETENMEENGREKYVSKNMDMIAINRVGDDVGPGALNNEMMIICNKGRVVKSISKRTKQEVAKVMVKMIVEDIKLQYC